MPKRDKRAKRAARSKTAPGKALTTQEREARNAERERAIDECLKASYDRMQTGQHEKAEAIVRKTLAKVGRDQRLAANLVAALEGQGAGEKALEVAAAGVEAYPDDVRLHTNYGAMLKFVGRLDEAETIFRRAIELAPENANAWRNATGLKQFESAEDPDLKAMQTLLERMPRASDGRPPLYFSIARALDQIGDTENAFQHFERGNRIARAKTQFSMEKFVEFIDGVIECQTPERVNAGPARGASDHAPILIVGMPRSGSTLIEQILAAHPDVQGVGEVPDLVRAMEPHIIDTSRRVQSLAVLDDEKLAALGKTYSRFLEKRVPGAKRITDKFLSNFVHLGTVRRALPNARFIHASRSAMDNGFACFKTHFTSSVPYVYDVDEIAGVYAQTHRLVNHWQSIMPEAVTTVSYESLINDIEGETRRLLDFLGLPWNDACLRFHEVNRRVNSASATQVRKPLYRTALSAWKPYEQHLGPLKAAFEKAGVAPE